MRLINRRIPETGYDFHHNRWGVQKQVRLIIVLLACLSNHLALFQLVGASTQSSLSLQLGNGKARSRGQAVIASVPNKDRGLFVIYHLAKALNFSTSNPSVIMQQLKLEPETPPEKSQNFKDIRTYDTFSADLLKWTMGALGLSRNDVSHSLIRRRRVLCTTKGLCFNPNDIGSMCCPF